MPRVPISNRQIQERAFQSRGVAVRGPEEVKTNYAEGLSNLTNTASKIYQAEKRKAYDSTAKETENKLRDEYNRSLYDPESGFTHVKGKNTTEVYKQRNEAYKKFVDETLSKVGDADLRNRLTAELGDTYKGRHGTALDQHTGREMDNYHNEMFKSSLSSIKNDAINGYMSGINNSSSASVEKASLEIQEYGESKGLSKEGIEQIKLESSSDIHSGVIVAAVNNKEAIVAKEYFKKVLADKQLTPNDAARLSKLVDSASNTEASQAIADSIISKDMSYEASLAEARKAKGELRDEAVSRVKQRWNEKKVVKEERDKANFNSLVDQLSTNKSLDGASEEQKILMSAKQKKVTDSILDMISKGYKPTTDPRVEQDLTILAATDPKAFQRKDVNLFAHKLSDGDRQRFLNMQKSIKEGDGKHDQELGDFMAHTTQIKNNLKEFGITSEKEEAKFQNYIQKEAVRWQRANKAKKIPDDELQKIIDKALTPGEVKGPSLFGLSLYDPNKRAYQLEEGESFIVNYEDIPQSEIAKFREVYKKHNIKPSEERIVRDYTRYLSTK